MLGVIGQLPTALQTDTAALHLHREQTFDTGHTNALVNMTQVETRLVGLQPARTGLDADRLTRTRHHFHFTTDQFDPRAAADRCQTIDPGLGVEFQADIVAQVDAPLLADFGNVIGTQPGKAARYGFADQEKCRRRRNGTAEKSPSAELPGTGRMLQLQGGRLEGLPHRLAALERLGVFRTLRAPLAQGPGIGGGGPPRGQEDQPILGFAVQSSGLAGPGISDGSRVQARRYSRRFCWSIT